MVLLGARLRVHGGWRARHGDGGALVSPWWLVAAYTFHTFGELCLSPIGLSLVTKLAPAKFAVAADGPLVLRRPRIAEFLAGQLAALTDKIARGELFHLFGGQADFYFVFVVALGGRRRWSSLALFAPWLQPPDARARCVKVVAAALGLLLSSAVAAAKPTAIATRNEAVVDHLHGVDVPDPYRWLEDGDAPEVQRWTEAQNAATRKALDASAGARGAGSSGSGRLYRDRLARARRSSASRQGKRRQGRAATSTRAATASRTRRCSTCATARRAPTARWSTSTASAPTARARSTGGSPPTTARWSPTASPTTAARSRCCACATWRPAAIWRRDPAHARLLARLDCPTASGFYYTRYPTPGEVPAGEEKYHRGVFFHRLGDDPAQGPQALRRRARSHRLAQRRSLARRALAGGHGQPGLVEERGLPARHHAPRAPRRRSPSPPARTPTSTSSRCSTIGSTCSRPAARRAAGSSPSTRAHPARAHWREMVPEGAGGRPRERGLLSAAGSRSAILHDAAARLRLFDPSTARRAARCRCPGWAR